MCAWSMTSVPPSSSVTLVAISAQRLPHGDERRGALLLELSRAVGVVLEQATAGLDAELALVHAVRDRARHALLVREVLVQVARDRVVDVEPGHVEQRHGWHDGELVADPPLDVEIELL